MLTLLGADGSRAGQVVRKSELRKDEVADVIDLRAPRGRIPFAEATSPNAVLSDFYETDYPQIVAAVAMIGRDVESACDAVDEAVAGAWQDGIASSGLSVFAASVRQRAVTIARKGTRRKLLERKAGKRMRAELVIDRDTIDGALTLDVQRVLQTLSPRQREVVVLHYMFDMATANPDHIFRRLSRPSARSMRRPRLRDSARCTDATGAARPAT